MVKYVDFLYFSLYDYVLCLIRSDNMEWSKEQIDFLIENYPTKGKFWCCNALGLKEHQVRYKASALKLTIDRSSEFIKTAIEKRRKTITGRKRPEQADVMKNLWNIGKIKNPCKKERVCIVCGNTFYYENSKNHRKTCSDDCFEKYKSNMWKVKEHPKGMLGKKHTEEVKSILSEKHKDNWDNLSTKDREDRVNKMLLCKLNKYGSLSANNREKCSWKAGWREIGGKRKYYRSLWEANYARYLEFLKKHKEIKDWQHEPKTFWFDNIKRGCRSYLPDFEVINNDGSVEYHEVKGWYDDRSKTKIKRMKKYYPDVVLKIIFAKEYNTLKRQLSSIIKDWE